MIKARLLTLPMVGMLSLFTLGAFAQTDGTAKLETTIASYSVDGPDHWTVAWVTTESGTFIKSLRKQGTSYGWTSSQWTTHCTTWNAARGGTSGSQVLDGYSSATATTYTGTNSPIILTWNCRDASGNLMPDGNYKFWVQYAEDHLNAEGPYTVGGLLWTKGAASKTNTYANQGANFTNMRVTWTASTPATVAPSITSAAPPAAATVGVAYNHTCTASGTAPITFTASGLPTGLSMSPAGVISGYPTLPGTYSGTITAANGTLPNATQAFSISPTVVASTVSSVRISGNNIIMSGTGPANGRYAVLGSPGASGPWTPFVTNQFSAAGQFQITNAMPVGAGSQYYKLRIP